MRINKFWLVFIIVCMMVNLMACSGDKEIIGVTRQAIWQAI